MHLLFRRSRCGTTTSLSRSPDAPHIREKRGLAPEGMLWDNATQDERDFCYECVLAIVRETDLIDRYYGRTPTTT
jgi:hypothetical protein